MNELNELEKWLNKIIEDNDAFYNYCYEVGDNKNGSSCVSRGVAYKRVLKKVHTLQRAQKRGENND